MTALQDSAALRSGLFAAIDARDTDGFLRHLTPDARFRFGSAPAVTGQDAVREAVDGFFSTIAGLSHRLDRWLEQDGCLVCEGEVTYTRKDGSDIALPFVDVFELDGELIRDYKIYMDIGPLYSD